MAIQRWDFDVWSGCEEEDSEGEFVKLADHLSDKATALARQRDGIAEMVIPMLCKHREFLMDGEIEEVVDAIRAYVQEEK